MDFIEAKTPEGYVPPLLLPALGFAGGIAAANLFIYYPYAVTCTLVIVVLVLLVTRRLSPRHIFALSLSVIAGFSAYSLYGPGAPSYASGLLRHESPVFLAEVVEPPRYGEGYTALTVKPLIPEGISRIKYRRAGLVRLTLKGTSSVGYGDLVRCDIKLTTPRGFMVPGVFDYGEYARMSGIDATGSGSYTDVVTVISASGSPLRGVYDFRAKLMRSATGSLSPESAAIYNAIILGDQSGVTDGMRDEFQRSGTTHILSVSGSHVALFAAVVYLLVGYLPLYVLPERLALRLTMRFDIRKLAAAAAIPAMVMYCLIAGSELPTVRSVIMIGVYLGSVLIGRHKQVVNTLSLAALVILIPDPSALFDISFRLSFLSVLFMTLAARRARGLFESETLTRHGFVRNVLLAALMCVAAIAGTYPFVAGQFNSFSFAAPPANLIVMPFAGFVAVPLGLLSALLGFVTGTDTLPLASLNGYALGAFYGAVRAFAAIPGSGASPPAPGPLFTAVYYAGLVLFLLGRKRSVRYAGGAALAVSVALSVVLPVTVRPDGMRVSFLDVRQGDSALVELPGGQVMLIDTGGRLKGADPGRNAVAPYLRNLGIRRIDYLVLSHPAVDHIAGAVYILQNFEVGQVWESFPGPDSSVYRRLSELADKSRVERHVISDTGEFNLGGVTVQVLNHGAGGGSDNDRSLVLRLKYKEVSFLFTGDTEAGRQREMVLTEPALPLKSTVLKVPHHGSPDADSPSFRLAVDPVLAVVSSGQREEFGHPADSVVEGLLAGGASVYGTNRDGTVIVTTDGQGVQVETARELSPARVRNWQGEKANYGRLLKRLRLM